MSQYVDWTATPVSMWVDGNVWGCEWKWCVDTVVVLYLSIIRLAHTQIQQYKSKTHGFAHFLALEPTFGIHSNKSLDTDQPCHLLKPNWKASASYSTSAPSNINTSFCCEWQKRLPLASLETLVNHSCFQTGQRQPPLSLTVGHNTKQPRGLLRPVLGWPLPKNVPAVKLTIQSAGNQLTLIFAFV